MSHTHPPDDAAIQQVLRRILVLNLLVAAAKLSVGVATGAIAMIADGFHSLVDGLSNVVAIVAQWIAAQPPDDDHPYGHRRYESLATLIIGGLMMVAAWEVLQTAIGRLLDGGDPPTVTAQSYAVLLVTLVINIGVVWYERRRGQQLGSRVLIADAGHTFTDVLVTCSVIVSLVLVQAGLVWADAVVALGIVALITRIAWEIFSESTKVLVDAVAIPPDEIAHIAEQVPNVTGVSHVRSRSVGDAVHVDLQVSIPRTLSADHAHNIGAAVEDAVHQEFPSVGEVQVTLAPAADTIPNHTLQARAAADSLGLGVHEIIAIPTVDGVILEMHVEVARGITLQAAHEQVTTLERKLLTHDDVRGVITHIEPDSEHGAPMAQSQTAIQLRDQAVGLAHTLYPQANWHDATIRLALGGYALTMHCHLPGTTSVEEAHHIAEQVETHIRSELPAIQRVTIHTEPSP